MHDACPQAWLLSAFAQPLGPHVPVLPHGSLFGFVQAASLPEVTGLQAPVPSQVMHAPVQADVQHTPSTHIKLAPQLFPVPVHACPATHPVHLPVIVLQPLPLAQSESIVHDVLHRAPLQVKSPQGVVTGAEHTPAPLHIAAVVWL